jgi:ABC-2 type transport system permease protein
MGRVRQLCDGLPHIILNLISWFGIEDWPKMPFFIISIKNLLAYRWGVLFSILSSVVVIAINLMLWRFLYRGDPDAASYMVKYTIFSNIIAMFYGDQIVDMIGKKVASGDFVLDVIKPVNFLGMLWQLELARICSKFLLCGIPVIIVYLRFLTDSDAYRNIALVVASVAMGHVLCVLLFSLIGFSAFILIEVWPFRRLITDTIRLFAGAFIPIAILPLPIARIARVLPFRFMYSFPLEMLFGRADTEEIPVNFAVFFAWIVTLAALNIVMYRTALEKTSVQGG